MLSDEWWTGKDLEGSGVVSSSKRYPGMSGGTK
jgi:hypothetical protein